MISPLSLSFSLLGCLLLSGGGLRTRSYRTKSGAQWEMTEGRDELVSIVCYYHSSSSPLSSTAEGRERDDRQGTGGREGDGMASTGLTGEESTGKERRGEREKREGGGAPCEGTGERSWLPERSVVALNLTMVATGLGSARGGEGLHGGAGSQRRGGGVSSCDGTAEARMRVWGNGNGNGERWGGEDLLRKGAQEREVMRRTADGSMAMQSLIRELRWSGTWSPSAAEEGGWEEERQRQRGRGHPTPPHPSSTLTSSSDRQDISSSSSSSSATRTTNPSAFDQIKIKRTSAKKVGRSPRYATLRYAVLSLSGEVEESWSLFVSLDSPEVMDLESGGDVGLVQDPALVGHGASGAALLEEMDGWMDGWPAPVGKMGRR
jgi:hypothetical protein